MCRREEQYEMSETDVAVVLAQRCEVQERKKLS
jgi:hypothetical protein